MKTAIYTFFFLALGCLTVLGCTRAPEGQKADDIVSVPGAGPQYRANVHQAGVKNPWPTIDSTKVTLGNPEFPALLTYRSEFSVKPGSTVNNIVDVFLPAVDSDSFTDHRVDVVISPVDFPTGIEATVVSRWYGPDPARHCRIVVEFRTGQELGQNQYSVLLDIQIDQVYYGRIQVDIDV